MIENEKRETMLLDPVIVKMMGTTWHKSEKQEEITPHIHEELLSTTLDQIWERQERNWFCVQ
jgi:hypothetical protein